MQTSDADPPEGPESALTGGRQVFASGIWVAVSTIVPFLATAVLSVVAGRVLGAELLGQQSLIAFVGSLVTTLAVYSLTEASIRQLAACRSGAPREVAALERWSMRAHVVAGLSAAAVVAAVGLLRDDYVLAWLVVAVNLLVDAVGWALSARSIARDGWGPVARRRLVTLVLGVGLGIVAVLMGFGIVGIFAANLFASLVLLVLLVPLTRRSDEQGSRTATRPVLRMWGLFAGGAVLTQVISGRMEIVLLGAFSTGQQIAQYSVAVMLVTSAIMIPTALGSAAMPAVAAASGAGQEERAGIALSRALRVNAVLSLPLAALLVASGPAFVVGLYGGEFEEAGRLARFIAVGAVVIPCGRLATMYWSGVGRLRVPIVAGAVGAVLELALGLVLIPRLEAPGAVVATLVGQGVAAVVVVALTWRALGRLSLGRKGWLAAACVSAVAAAAGAAAASTAAGLPGAVLGGIVTTAVFVAGARALAALGRPVLTGDDADWLRGVLPERLGGAVVLLTGR